MNKKQKESFGEFIYKPFYELVPLASGVVTVFLIILLIQNFSVEYFVWIVPSIGVLAGLMPFVLYIIGKRKKYI